MVSEILTVPIYSIYNKSIDQSIIYTRFFVAIVRCMCVVELGRYRYSKSVSVFGIVFGIFESRYGTRYR